MAGTSRTVVTGSGTAGGEGCAATGSGAGGPISAWLSKSGRSESPLELDVSPLAPLTTWPKPGMWPDASSCDKARQASAARCRTSPMRTGDAPAVAVSSRGASA